MGNVAVCGVGPPGGLLRGFGLMGREGGKEGRRGDRLFNSPANPGASFICTARCPEDQLGAWAREARPPGPSLRA